MTKLNGKTIAGHKVYTLEELSGQLGIHLGTLRRYVREGRVVAQKIGKRYLVTQENIERFINPKEPPESMARQRRLF